MRGIDSSDELTKLRLTAEQRTALDRFCSGTVSHRISNVSVLGDSGEMGQFYLLYYAILLDPDQEVQLAAFKRLRHFTKHPDFLSLLKKIKELEIQDLFEPEYSTLLGTFGEQQASSPY